MKQPKCSYTLAVPNSGNIGSVAESNSTDEVSDVIEVNGVGVGTEAPSEAVSVETNSDVSVDVELGEVLSSGAGAVPSR